MKGLLLINLGTPDAPTPKAVRRYLRTFLSDPRVLDINPVGRWLLLNAVILPRRPKHSAAAYEQIWDPVRGSPLLFHSEDLVAGVRTELGPEWSVALGMRYGQPSIAAAVDALQAAGAEHLVILPLYPHYASSSTGSSLAFVHRLLERPTVVPTVTTVGDFFDAPGFIGASAAVARPSLDAFQPDHVLLSFHGLPERQVRACSSADSRCLADAGCCDVIDHTNRYCYRAQCFATARALTGALALEPGGWSVAFQSRLGRTPWIRPFTDEQLPALAAAGVRRLAVMCPSFVADCLETLEEIGIRARDTFIAAGGEALALVPCVNSDPRWVRAVADMAREAVGATV